MPQPFKIVYLVEPDAAALTQRAARYFVESVEAAVAARGRARIAISGGSAPRPVFAALADPALPWRDRMPWKQLEIFFVDERCVPLSHPASNDRMAREALLDKVPLGPQQIHRFEGELEPEEAAARYESGLRNSFRLEGAEAPRFDLIHLGLGANGHTASLFPHTAALHELGRLAVANLTDAEQPWRLTLTAPVINRGADVFFLIAGSEKAQMVKEVFAGPRDPDRLPAQLIRPAGGILTLLLDRAAAALLPPPHRDGRGELG
ncbi:MAG: 6-phosphogluconolactonase [Acidobacteriota bacterium]